MNNAELSAIMNDRMLAYQFLACAFRAAPDVAFLSTLLPLANDYEESSSDGAGSSIPLQAFLKQLHSGNIEELDSDIAADYARLFLNMSPNPVSLYESVYTSPEHLLMQQSRNDVVAAYSNAGFASTKDFDLPEDHLSCELEFMSLLAAQTKAALENNKQDTVVALLEQQQSFLSNHLSVWLPEFCTKVTKEARTIFFSELANMTQQQIYTDEDFLEGLKFPL